MTDIWADTDEIPGVMPNDPIADRLQLMADLTGSETHDDREVKRMFLEGRAEIVRLQERVAWLERESEDRLGTIQALMFGQRRADEMKNAAVIA